jgi:uncharacterized membrane protein YeaQ/YmgE (transglycosylase-associated protein family)
MNQNINNYEQVLSTIIAGYVGALIPNDRSNIPPLLLSVIFGAIVSKVVYGDFDKGYTWTKSDILYWVLTVTESIIGGCLALYIKKISQK